MNQIHSFLEHPKIYNISQKFLALLNLNRDSIGGFLRSEIRLNPGEKILDVGCGTGRYAKIFSGNQYFGVDNNPQYIEYAKSKNGGIFGVMDAAKLNFPDESFDYVISIQVFHHLSDEEVRKTVKEMQRVLKGDGKIYITDAVTPSVTNFVGYSLFKLDRGKHTRKLSELNKLLAKHNFSLYKENLKGSFPYQVSVFYYQKSNL